MREAVLRARPDAILHQATALAGARFGRSLDRTFGPTSRLRPEGTDALLAAARQAGARALPPASRPASARSRFAGSKSRRAASQPGSRTGRGWGSMGV